MVAHAAFHSDRSVEGLFFYADGAPGKRAMVRISVDSVVVVVEEDRLLFPLGSVSFGPMRDVETGEIRLGPKASFRSTDFDGLQHIAGLDDDTLAAEAGSSKLHKLILFTLALLVSGFLTLTWFRGVPILEQSMAQTVPSAVKEKLSANALRYLEASVLTPSRLDIEQRESITQMLAESSKAAGFFMPKIQFRFSSELGPNAVALPDGTIMVTDQLVQRVSENELRAVVAYQMGHVANHHSLKALISEAPFAWFVAIASGDYWRLTQTASEKLLTVRYTAKMENAADDFAVSYFSSLGYTDRDYRVAIQKVVGHHVNDMVSPNLGPWLSTQGNDHPLESEAKPQSLRSAGV